MEKQVYDYAQMGRNIRQWRVKQQITQAELAGRTRCSAQMISKLECGRCSMSVELFMNLCRELRCTPSDLLANTR